MVESITDGAKKQKHQKRKGMKMKNTVKVMTLAAVMVIGTAAFAGPRHDRPHHKRDGLDLAYGIVNLVRRTVNPAPVVYTPAPAPVVYTPAPAVAPRPAPRRHYDPPRNNHHRPNNQRNHHRR